ncbi:MGH1-like glycoside hydrolase domain-containing protein [Abditibacterium utsteinense]|nr:glycosyl hydrolase family 65 protein [Abditibacterium utsteinense]
MKTKLSTKKTSKSFQSKASVALLPTTLFLAAMRPAAAQNATPVVAAVSDAPQLQFQNRLLQGTLGKAYDGALDNLLRVNTIPDTQGKFDPTGLMAKPPGTFIRAGGGYQEPWTRDASLNSWNAASLLEPVVARNTLWAVCQKTDDGRVVLQRDNQWWDKVIWITAAWNHFKVTGDQKFLVTAYEVAQDELQLMRREHFNSTYGLFQGPAFFADGIAAYPEPEFDPKVGSNFVLDHPFTKDMMSLSTNCVYYEAYRSAAQMGAQLERPMAEIQANNAAADALKTAINRQLWNPQTSTYSYFIHGAGPLLGKRDNTQEGIGLSYAILFGVADAKQAQSILKTAHRTPHGLPAQWPHFPRFSDGKPGRHNVIIWPNVNGMWACAAAQAGDIATFRDEVENLALLSQQSDNHFYEIYNSLSGKPDGGWQGGGQWGPLTDQTWSATAYLRMMYQGLFGMEFQPNGIYFAPKLPSQWSGVKIQGMRYRSMILDIDLQGEGTRVAHVAIDGKVSPRAFIPATLSGQHRITISMKAE